MNKMINPFITNGYAGSTCSCNKEDELTALIEENFHLPYFEFIYDEHWDLGHGWSGDFK